MTLQNFSERIVSVENRFISIFENSLIIFGYTHKHAKTGDILSILKNQKYIELTQIHSNIIFPSNQIKKDSRGDGFILTEGRKIGIIKTADCVPLFFWDRDYSIGGILHVGWKGLFHGIETRLFPYLKKRGISPGDMHFHFGPSIQKECYTVSKDLFDKFSVKSYRDQIFFKNISEDYQMDIKKGIISSLISLGINDANISDSSICTFCQNRSFPSYRFNGGKKDRILNFIMIKKDI